MLHHGCRIIYTVGPARSLTSYSQTGGGVDERLRRAAWVRAARAFETADRTNGHVVVAEHLTRQPDTAEALAVSTSCSAAVIREGSPSTNSTRQVVHRALPPHACRISTFASCSIAQHQTLVRRHVERP
jgi:hypothetical protein